MTSVVEDNLRLVCRVGTRQCALRVADIAETMRPLPTTPLAGAPSFVLGLAIIRDEPVPVVDLARLIGAEPTAATRFVLIKVGDRRIALAVDKIVGIEIVEEAAFTRLPPLLGGANGDVLACVGTLDSELCVILDNARLLPDAIWSTIALVGSS